MLDNLRDKIIKRISNELWNFKKNDFRQKLENHKIKEIGRQLIALCLFSPFFILLSKFLSIFFGILIFISFVSIGFQNYKMALKSEYKKMKKNFMTNYSIENEYFEQFLKNEFSDNIRINALLSKDNANHLLNKGILNLNNKEYKEFLNVPLNNEQVKEILNILEKNQAINIFTISKLLNIESKSNNYITEKLGIPNPTLKTLLEDNQLVVNY